LKANENQYLTINQAITLLREVEQKKKNGIITPDTVAIGIARAGSDNPNLKADFIRELANFDFGEPPYSLIIPGELHFMEVDSLIAFAGAPAEFRRIVK
jgi:diphthine synthase